MSRGGQGVQGCLAVQGVPKNAPELYGWPTTQQHPGFCAVGQMAQGTPFRCLPWPTPPHNFKALGGGKGEVKPPKSPTRHPGLADRLA